MPLDISRIQAICFDIDGTLSDTDDKWVRQTEKWLKWFRPFFPHQDAAPFCTPVNDGFDTRRETLCSGCSIGCT